ncbi:hypothetical protein V3C99_001333, partial [Haemonchus contortus]
RPLKTTSPSKRGPG